MFTQGPSLTVRLVVLVLISILLMTLDHRQQHLSAVRSSLSIVVSPIQFLVDLPGNLGSWVTENLSTRRTLLEDNARLRSQHLLLEAQIQKTAALERENRRLRELLGSSFKVSDRVLIAELYKVDLDPYKHLVRVNKGSGDEVYIDQPVLDSAGVMGQIIEVNPIYSTARLITDSSQVIPVQVNRNGLRTIAVGTGSLNQLSLPYLPNHADIRKGDLLITSGLGGIYPFGYPVAVVMDVVADPGSPFAHITAAPTAHLDRSREVLLVWSGYNLEQDEIDTPGPEARP